MYLTQILIDKKTDTICKLKLWDSYGWHQALWHAFPQLDGKQRNFLFRVDDERTRFKALLLSWDEPIKQPWSALDWKTKKVDPNFLSYSAYRFQLRANPTMKKTYPDGKKRRIGLYQEDLLQDWIFRKAEQGGFQLSKDHLSIGGPMDEKFWIPGKKQKGQHVSVDFRGALKVKDCLKFQTAFQEGIGSAKAFGFGLLMLQPIQ